MTPTIPTILPGAAGVHLVRTGEHGCSLLPNPSWRKKGTPVGSATQPTFCLSHLLPDKDDYTELLGAVDNAFLVAYAIGMFIR